MHTLFDRNIYDLSVKYLSKNKTLSLDNIPNSILKNMPHRFHNLFFLFFQHCYKQKTILQSWKISNTILIYKKGNPSHLFNHCPIALASTIYKLFTSTLTSILSAYGELNQILYNRVIRKVTHKTRVCILEEESEHQTFLCTKRRLKKIWTGV